jgi:archaetidylinositol phosphate synthase
MAFFGFLETFFMDPKYRQLYEQKTIQLGKYCTTLRLSPNVLSILGTVSAIGSAFFLWNSMFFCSLFFLIFSGIFDILDGATARYNNIQSAYGTVFDRLNDRYSEFFIAAGLLGCGRVHPFWILFSLVAVLLASYVRACAESAGKVRNCSVGLMERKEKAVLFSIGMILETILNPAGLTAKTINPIDSFSSDGVLVLQIVTIFVGLFSHFTVFQRLRYTKYHENEVR